MKDCFGETPKPIRETRAQPRLPRFDYSTQFLLQFLQTPWLINLQMQQQTDFFGSATKVFTVAELTRAIRGTLETRFGSVWVQGEISNSSNTLPDINTLPLKIHAPRSRA